MSSRLKLHHILLEHGEKSLSGGTCSYRERKRGRVEALQGDIDALEEELRALQVQQQANAALAEKNKCAHSPSFCSNINYLKVQPQACP